MLTSAGYRYFEDMCLGGQKRNPEEIVKIFVEKAKLEGIALEATFHYVINVSFSDLFDASFLQILMILKPIFVIQV